LPFTGAQGTAASTAGYFAVVVRACLDLDDLIQGVAVRALEGR
jgi:hypothetical protein